MEDLLFLGMGKKFGPESRYRSEQHKEERKKGERGTQKKHPICLPKGSKLNYQYITNTTVQYFLLSVKLICTYVLLLQVR